MGGGTEGELLSCGAHYPAGHLSTELNYGPFSLVDAEAAELRFQAWVNTVSPVRFMWCASKDDSTWYCYSRSGNINGWREEVLDFENVLIVGDLLGQPKVWISFVLMNVGEPPPNSAPEGAFIDDIVLRKLVESR